MNRGTVWTSLAVATATLGIMVYAGLEALTFTEASMWFPEFVAIVGGLCSVAIIVKDVVTLVRRRPAKVGAADSAGGSTVDPDESGVDLSVLRSVAYWLAWMVALALIIVFAGAFVGMPVWLFVFLRFACRQRLLFSIVGAVATTAILFLITNALDFYVPQGIFE